MKDIMLVGDVMEDIYVYVKERKNPENAAPCYTVIKTTKKLGGAGNVFECLAKLRDHVYPIIYETGITKTRVIEKSSGRYICRLDDGEFRAPMCKTTEDRIISEIKHFAKDVDYILISDYAKGGVTKNIARAAINTGKKVIVDTKPKNLHFYKGAFLIKPNLKEALEMTGAKDEYDAGIKLVQKMKCNILITTGEKGMILFTTNESMAIFYPQKVVVKDVCGAGDTIIATLVHYLNRGKSFNDAAKLANKAAAITVTKVGCYQPTQREISRI